MKIPKELEEVVECTHDVLHGAPRFLGTRVFVSSLLDYVQGGYSLDQFLDDFPGVKKEQAEAVLAWQRDEALQALGLKKTA